MPDSWTLLEADADERERFPSRRATLALAGELAAPPNRLREVRRIVAGDRTWYLKTIRRTQLGNALALRRTHPRARNEAEREVAMAQALRRAGFAAPRIVALGREGRASFVLTAALPGTALVDRLAERGGRALLLAAAAHAGRALAQGFCLPDLSAEHVFVDGAADAPRFSFLDLGNARLGTPSRRDLARILRHAARSLRGQPVTRLTALRAAAALLRGAGRRDLFRALLSRMPPWHTHARYEVPGKADGYRGRDPRRSARELALLAGVWPGTEGEGVLDMPCGAGRLSAFLAARGHRGFGADRARAMLAAAPYRARACADAARLPFADRAVDGVVVFRFLHHLDRHDARAVVGEAARVAARWVVVSTFHPASAHAVWRRVRALAARRAPTRFAHAPARITRWFAAHGFTPAGCAREGALRELCVLSFRRGAAS